MTIRDWVQDKFASVGLNPEAVGEDGFAVSTPFHTHALVVIPAPGPTVFGAPQLNSVINDYPTVDSILLIRRPADEEVFAAASERGIQIDTLGNVTRALREPGKISRYQHPDEQYLRSRINRAPTVREIRRVGLSAWNIDRKGDQPTLKIITHNRYEFSASELQGVLDLHPGNLPHALVITNPYTNGLSTLVVNAAEQLDVQALLLDDFIENLRHATD